MSRIELTYDDILGLTQTFLGLERTLFSGLGEEPTIMVVYMQYLRIWVDAKTKDITIGVSGNIPPELKAEMHELLVATRSDIIESISKEKP